MFSLTYEFKLKPTAPQVAIFTNWLEQCRRVYNYALAERKDWFKSRSCRIDACSLPGEYIIPADAKRPTYASQCKGSNNWKKAQSKVSKLHERITNIRKEYHWKIAHQLCDRAGTIFVENLNLKGLSGGMLGKHCLDAGWGQFLTVLEQCCFKRGVYFQRVDPHKTSQICPSCLVETGKKLLSLRVHSCQHCGYTTDRDVAAAQVVLVRGLAAVCPTAKMLAEGKFIGIPAKQESPSYKDGDCQLSSNLQHAKEQPSTKEQPANRQLFPKLQLFPNLPTFNLKALQPLTFQYPISNNVCKSSNSHSSAETHQQSSHDRRRWQHNC